MTASARPSQFKRRKYLINRRFQLKFTALVVGAALVFALTVLADYYAYFGRHLSSNLLDPGLFHVFLAANKALVLKLVLFIVVFTGVSVLMSFRVAGPLFNMRRSFQAVAGGMLSHRVHLRKRDELQEMASDFNRMMDGIQRTMAGVHRDAEGAIAALEALSRTALDAGQKKTVDDLRERIRRMAASVRL